MSEQPTAVPNPTEATPVNGSGGDGPSRLRDHAQEVKRRGTKPGSIRGPYNKSGDKSTEKKPVGPVTPMFNEHNTARLLRTPFTIAAVRTRWEGFMLDPQEEKELTASAVPFLNEWVGVEPKYVAAFMFAYSLGSLALTKTLTYMAVVEATKIKTVNKPVEVKAEPSIKLPDGEMPSGELTKEQKERLGSLKATVAPKDMGERPFVGMGL